MGTWRVGWEHGGKVGVGTWREGRVETWREGRGGNMEGR